MATSEMKEGFLCPVCHKDLRSPNNLLLHFEDQHSEQQDLLKSFKDLMGFAKKKILKLNEHDIETIKDEISKDLTPVYMEVQKPGAVRSHIEYFKQVRRERLDHRTSEINKLVIRLDRLLNLWYYGSDRKQHEQELVTWLDGTTVTRCPSCAASFNIARRQHHCRLCGSIMCNSCSCFLSYDTAETLVAPIHNSDKSNREKPSKADSETLRICGPCWDMLELRRRAQFDQLVQPSVCQLYSLLKKLKVQIEDSVERYYKMYDSLNSGETTFHLEEAQSLRSNIAKQAESLDTLSKKIATLPVSEDDNPKTALLQSNVRRATAQYIKDALLTLPAPPDANELEKIRRERMQRYREVSAEESPSRSVKVKRVTVTTGWSSGNVDEVEDGGNEDPVVVQIRRVKKYIEKAKIDKRDEEVAALQENLKMLYEELEKSKKKKQQSD